MACFVEYAAAASLMNATTKALLLLSALLGPAGCGATPVPQPPGTDYALDVTKVTVEIGGSFVTAVVGAPGAVQPGSFELRITPVSTGDPPLVIGSNQVAADGSFDIAVQGTLVDLYYFEAVEPTGDVYFGVIQGDPPELADPGPDTDGDGSPDAIDCAPQDPNIQGTGC